MLRKPQWKAKRTSAFNIHLNNVWVIEAIIIETRINLELNYNENTARQNLQNTTKTVLRGKCILKKKSFNEPNIHIKK